MAARVDPERDPEPRRVEAQQFLSQFRRSVHDIVRQLSAENIPRGNLNAVSNRLVALNRNLNNTGGVLCTEDEATQLKGQLAILRDECNTLKQATSNASHGYRAPEVHSGNKGRPSLLVTPDQLRFLANCGFTINDMADILYVSPNTVKRRLRTYGITRGYNQGVSDQALDEQIQTTVRGNSSVGPNAVKARLAAKGLKVPRQRVRNALKRVDPIGCTQRSLTANNRLARRRYQVAAPLSMWHIDGNHKLIRWGMVIHGGVDGYSRLIVFLHASDNNRSQTVFDLFKDAVEISGMPSRVRVDRGGENNKICEFMEEERGQGRGSAIRGKSVHNQRIERQWVDVYNGCTNVYADLFNYLESTNALDSDNDVHRWAIHYIFLPRINRSLNEFIGQWNMHGLRTEHHATPQMLFVRGALANFSANLSAIRDLFDGKGNEGQDDNIPLDVDNVNVHTVTLPRVPCPLTPEKLLTLQETISPLDDSFDQHGIELYNQTVVFIQSNQ